MGRGSAGAYAYQDTIQMREHCDYLEDAKNALESGNQLRLCSLDYVIIIDSGRCQGLFPPSSHSLV